MRAADGILQQQELEPDEDEGEERNGDREKQVEKYNELEKFYRAFADKLKIYDPLERRIPEQDPEDEPADDDDEDEDEEENVNQAVSREELLSTIEKMPTLRGDLHVPMSNEMYSQLENLLQAEDTKCKDLAEAYFLKARKDDGEQELDFCDEPIVKNFQETLHFFKKYELLEGAARQADIFDLYVQQQTERIKQARDFRNISHVGQLIMESTQAIFQRYNEKNKTKSLVSEMI